MTTAVILSGGVAAYVDPWHPFAETSRLLAELLAENGFEVEVSFDPAARLADLSGVDLLVANTPVADTSARGALSAEQPDLAPAAAGLDAFLAREGGVLALHVSVTTLLGLPQWSPLIGARWVDGQTMHPPLGDARVGVIPGHALTEGLADFVVYDELYSHLAIDAQFEVLVRHELDAVDHPLVWVREVGRTRVVADALGHSEPSLRSDAHRALLVSAARWATRQN